MLIECSQVDTAPYISVLRDDYHDLKCGWLKVKPFPLYENKTRSKAAERQTKDVETGRSRGKKKSVGTRGRKPSNLELRPLKRVSPAQRLVKDANLAAERIMKRSQNLGSGYIPPSAEREWKPVASHASRYDLDESESVDIDCYGRRRKGSGLMAKNPMNHTVGLLVQRLLPREKMMGSTL